MGGVPRVAPVAPSKMRVRTVDPGADADVRGTAGLPPHRRRPVGGDPGLETRATFIAGCEPKDHE